MFGNNGNRSNEPSVNTTLDTLWSDLCSLTIGCWNYKISLRFAPVIPGEQRRFDVQHSVNTAIDHTTTAAIISMYENDKGGIKTAYTTHADPGDGISVAIPLTRNKENWLFLEYKKSATGTPAMFLTLRKTDASSGAKVISYQFSDTEIGVGINPESGGGTMEQVHSGFEYFISLLKTHVFMTGIQDHMTKLKMEYSKRRGAGGGNADDSGFNQMPGDFQVFQ